MTYVSPTDDIIVQEGTFGFSFEASGAISAGQLVKPAGPMQVVKSTSNLDNCVGVAAYTVTKGEVVTVYGPGNIVRGYCGSSTAVGSDLYAGNNTAGAFDDTSAYGITAPCVGIALEGAKSGAIRILLK